jgi:hypothetical protein
MGWVVLEIIPSLHLTQVSTSPPAKSRPQVLSILILRCF